MADFEKKVIEALDKIEIQDVLNRYAVGLDNHDLDMYMSVWAPDAVLDMQSWGQAQGTAAIEEAIKGIWVGLPKTTHVACNLIFCAYDGETATTRSAVFATAWNNEDTPVISYAAYEDTLKKIDGKWFICERKFDTKYTGEIYSLWKLAKAE